jgi:hypothetical protein
MKFDLPSLVFILLVPIILVIAWRILGKGRLLADFLVMVVMIAPLLFGFAWGDPVLRAAIIQWFPLWVTAILLGSVAAEMKRAEDVWSHIRLLRNYGAGCLSLGTFALGVAIISSPAPSMLLWPGLLISSGLVSILMVVFLRRRIIGGAV